MKETNELIKNFDFSATEADRLQSSLLRELNGLPIMTYKIQAGRKLFRCRRLNKITDLPYFSADLTYRRDIQNIRNFGRCNLFNSSKVYCSVGCNEQPGNATSLLETSSLWRDRHEGIELYAVGIFQSKHDLDVMAIKPPDSETKESQIYNEIRSLFSEDYKNRDVSADHREFYELFGKEICKPVGSSNSSQYAITAIASEIFLKHQVGLIYPSVITESKGLNVVFNPQRFDEFYHLSGVVICEYFKFKKLSISNNILCCDNTNSQPLQYRPVESSDRMPLKDLIQKFNDDGTSTEEIISKLIAQLNS